MPAGSVKYNLQPVQQNCIATLANWPTSMDAVIRLTVLDTLQYTWKNKYGMPIGRRLHMDAVIRLTVLVYTLHMET